MTTANSIVQGAVSRGFVRSARPSLGWASLCRRGRHAHTRQDRERRHRRLGGRGHTVAVAGGATAESSTTRAPIPFSDARLKIELNATDGDAGLQVFLDAEPWRQITITNPAGEEVVEVDADEVIRNYG